MTAAAAVNDPFPSRCSTHGVSRRFTRRFAGWGGQFDSRLRRYQSLTLVAIGPNDEDSPKKYAVPRVRADFDPFEFEADVMRLQHDSR